MIELLARSADLRIIFPRDEIALSKRRAEGCIGTKGREAEGEGEYKRPFLLD